MSSFFEEWKTWIKSQKRLSNNTISSYTRDLRAFNIFIKSFKNSKLNLKILSELDEDDLSAWFYERLKNSISHRSNARALSALKSFMNYLIKANVIKNSKILTIKGPKFLESLPRPLSSKQIQKIIAEIKNGKVKWIIMRNLSIIILMWGYGLRISETLNIKVSDLLRSELRVIGKGQKVRLIPMREELVSFIFKMLENMPFIYKDDSFVFLGEKGKKLKPEIIQRVIREIRNKCLLPDNTTPHSLRHTFATELLHNLVDLRYIQELLGHSSLSTTQKYTSVDSEHLKNILEKKHPRAG
ncbi:MAG: tyrosine-type recombinase/integrase [Alphaproteobacteria bacterium]|tara:strand:- start:717 stop:1613 length:897 start_codon:yes stop_codon:yes gene_type:complete